MLLAGVPSDGIPVTTIVLVSYAVLGVVIFYSVSGLVFSLVCFIFNVRNRNVRYCHYVVTHYVDEF